MSDCPVCGHTDGACAGNTPAPTTRQIITTSGVQTVNGPPRVPRQRVHVGRAGYIGKVDLYDPAHPNIALVQHDDEEGLTGDATSSSSDATAEPESAIPAADEGSAPKSKRKRMVKP